MSPAPRGGYPPLKTCGYRTKTRANPIAGDDPCGSDVMIEECHVCKMNVCSKHRSYCTSCKNIQCPVHRCEHIRSFWARPIEQNEFQPIGKRVQVVMKDGFSFKGGLRWIGKLHPDAPDRDR